MADSKVSALSSATSPLAGTDTFYVVQGGASKKTTVADIPIDSLNAATPLSEAKGGTGGTAGANAKVQFKDEGVSLGTSGTVTEVDFTGTGVSASRVGNVVTVNIADNGTVTSVDATQGVETVSGSAITATGTIRGSELVNAQTGTTYTVLTGDRGKLITHSNASAIAVTLPQAGASFPSGWYCDVENRGAGAVTITPTTSTIDGAATLVLNQNQGARIVSDGTNYFVQRGTGSNNAAHLSTGILPDARMPDLTGDVTTTEGAVATTIANNAVTTAKILDSNVTSAKLASDITFPGRVIDQVVALTDGANIATNAALGNVFTVTLGGNRTMDAPTNPVNGQKIIYRIRQDATGSRTLTWNAAFSFTGDVPTPTLSTTAAKVDYVGFMYNGTDSVWDAVAFKKGS